MDFNGKTLDELIGKEAALDPADTSMPIEIGEKGEFAAATGYGLLEGRIKNRIATLGYIADLVEERTGDNELSLKIRDAASEITELLDHLFSQAISMRTTGPKN